MQINSVSGKQMDTFLDSVAGQKIDSPAAKDMYSVAGQQMDTFFLTE